MPDASSTWQARLAQLHRAAIARVPEPPDWQPVATRARKQSLAAGMLRQVASAADEMRDATLDELPSGIEDALGRVAPSFDLEVLKHYPVAALAGLANAVKGALFELEVANAVATGALPLPDGVASFRLVDDFSTPGFDAELFDADGSLVDVVQLKISSAATIIERHLALHPDIPTVWTSTEAAGAAAHRGLDHVVDTGISNADLSDRVADALADAADTSLGEVLDELVPQFTLAVIAVQAGWQLLQGTPTPAVAAWAKSRVGNAMTVSALAGLASLATGADAVRIPVALGVSFTRAGYAELDGATRRMEGLRAIAEGLAASPAA